MRRADFNAALVLEQMRKLRHVSRDPPHALSALIWINGHPFNSCSTFLMISFTYQCPRTGQKVQGHVADELIDGETFELVTCTACGGTHLINPKTGRLLEQAKR
jgi:hypothetical protein